MRLALQEERRNRDLLLGELNQTRSAAEQKNAQLAEREKEIVKEQQARSAQAEEFNRSRVTLSEEVNRARSLAESERKGREEMASLAHERQAALELERQNRELLQTQLDKARLDAQRQQSLAAQLDQRMQDARRELEAKEKQMLDAVQQQAALRQQAAAAADQAARLEGEIRAEREERARLAQNLVVMATNSAALAQEIRDNRPKTANAFFDEFITNRVAIQFQTVRSTLVGLDTSNSRKIQAVLATDGSATYALCHVDDTPLIFTDPAEDFRGFDGTFSRGSSTTPAQRLSFHAQDPRLILLPISGAEVRALGAKAYRISPEPFKFADAIVIGPRQGSYGECKFQIDLSTPGYVRMDRNTLTGLFGKFNPSSGDIVFSRSGELLGIMVNGTYCLVLRDFKTSATFRRDSA